MNVTFLPKRHQGDGMVKCTGIQFDGPDIWDGNILSLNGLAIMEMIDGHYAINLDLPAFGVVDLRLETSDLRVLGPFLPLLDAVMGQLVLRAPEEGYGSAWLKILAMQIHEVNR